MAFYNVQIYFASDKSNSLHGGFDLGLQMNSLIFEQHVPGWLPSPYIIPLQYSNWDNTYHAAIKVLLEC